MAFKHCECCEDECCIRIQAFLWKIRLVASKEERECALARLRQTMSRANSQGTCSLLHAMHADSAKPPSYMFSSLLGAERCTWQPLVSSLNILSLIGRPWPKWREEENRKAGGGKGGSCARCEVMRGGGKKALTPLSLPMAKRGVACTLQNGPTGRMNRARLQCPACRH